MAKRNTIDTMGKRQLVKTLDSEFSMFVRMSAADDGGWVVCPTSGLNETFEAGKSDLKSIHIIYGDPALLQMRFTGGKKISFANLPFKYIEWEDVCTDTLDPDIPF